MTSIKLAPMVDVDRSPAAPRRAPPTRPTPGEKRRSGALAIGAGLVAAWIALIAGRVAIVKLLPAAAPVYAALGMKVNLRQMDLLGVTAKLVEEDGRKILLVQGQIKNIDASPRTPPRMRLAVEDGQGREIYFWTAAPPKSRLNPGENAYFRARLAAPPEEGAEVRVRFAPEASAT
ncbi:Protein of unknown function [Rhodoblastus acidophilus]|uniref:DUF3426 domain-containing protein n=1 Tax=Rhodoblastus acidophilus TaxID=1074 RepID=A0A212R2M8_RHOAC|nr:DUF3426 domain-containing protein [Rhodoblastus acidophilus]PPQ40305.1 DUF3426 domain-containing protein [Rhodoblastus acidophilus]RAI17402.1 DUF3426 domain-containing protein [Rhodoblastus acidophilus]SNB66235.1 Protein of unknown function [Rhodoblastus acidophilus]